MVGSFIPLSLSWLTFNMMLSFTPLKGRVLPYSWGCCWEIYSSSVMMQLLAFKLKTCFNSCFVAYFVSSGHFWEDQQFAVALGVTVGILKGLLQPFSSSLKPCGPQASTLLPWCHLLAATQRDGISKTKIQGMYWCPRVWWKTSSDTLLFIES